MACQLNPHQLAALARHFRDEFSRTWYLFVYLAILRRREALLARCSDIQLEARMLRIRDAKYGAFRAVPLGPVATQSALVLRSHASGHDQGLLLLDPTGGTARREGWFRSEIEAAVAAAGFKPCVPSFHDVRRSAIFHLIASGASETHVRLITGASPWASTSFLHGEREPSPDVRDGVEAGVMERFERAVLGDDFSLPS